MSARPLFRPVLVHGGNRGLIMRECPTEDMLILFASTRPDTDPDDGELLDGWTAAEVAEHVTLCTSCRSTVEVTGALTRTLRDDGVDDPAGEFWDELASDVMRSIDELPAVEPGRPGTARGRDRHGAADDAEVIPLRRPMQFGRLGGSPVERQRAVWLWGAAAALALALSVAAYLTQRPDDGTADGTPTPVALELPDAEAAAAAAAELGLSLDPIVPEELAEVNALQLGGAFEVASESSLRRSIEGADATDVELALGYDDAISELFELDAEAMDNILSVLESRT